jgi:hypothetical protein
MENGRRLWQRRTEYFTSGQFWLNGAGNRLAIFRSRVGSIEVLGGDGAHIGLVPLKNYLAKDEMALLPVDNCGTDWATKISLRENLLSVVVPQYGNHDPYDPAWSRRTITLLIDLGNLSVRR